MLEQDVLSWSALKDGASLGPIKQRLERSQNRDLTDSEIKAVLDKLTAQELLEKSGSEWRLSEPDRDEVSLYSILMSKFEHSSTLTNLGIQQDSYVLEDTSRIAGSEGRYSRPDLMIAAIHTWKYDPARSLEVYSFEVKNRKGTNVPAVYEALAHARFVNHPFLVVPSTRLDMVNLELVRLTCEREGVGLIQFDLSSSQIDPGFIIGDVKLIVEPERRATNPRTVEAFLEARLSDRSKTALDKMARRSGT